MSLFLSLIIFIIMINNFDYYNNNQNQLVRNTI